MSQDDVMGDIEHYARPLDAGASRKEAQRAIATGIKDIVYHVRDDVNKAFIPLDAYLGAVEALEWVADRYAKTLAGQSVRDADEALERARIILGGQ